jgi:Ca-activated chloride channel family protein
MWSLEAPAALLLFLLLPPLIYQIHFRRSRGGKIPFSYRIWQGAGFQTSLSFRRFIYMLSWFVFWLGLCSLFIALSGPVRIQKTKIFLNRGLDIMIVLDESPSMLAQDFKPEHRFGTAKKVIEEFIGGRENDQIGIVSFSQEALLRVPVTDDYSLLLSILSSLDVMELGDGTAIGMGLSLASLHLQGSDVPGRVIILLTDGENNAGEVGPVQAAELARRLGIRIYCIGIGKEGEAYMELKDPVTGKIMKGKYIGKFDEALLQKIAALSGGKYFHARNPGTLSSIFEQINALEKTEKRFRLEVERIPLHRGFLLAALLMVAADFFIRKGLLKELM